MKPVIDASKAHSDTDKAFLDLRGLYGSDQYRMFADWIEALAAQQQTTMATCRAEHLPAAQTRLKQLMAMLNALVEDKPLGNGHQFD
jgi:hypothetical protein